MIDDNSKLDPDYEKELRRAYINAFLSPEYDDFLSLEDDSYFEKLYGKEGYQAMKKELAERLSKEKAVIDSKKNEKD